MTANALMADGCSAIPTDYGQRSATSTSAALLGSAPADMQWAAPSAGAMRSQGHGDLGSDEIGHAGNERQQCNNPPVVVHA